MKLKILIRRNLKMSKGKTAAQAVHSALGLYKLNKVNCNTCIVLEVSDKKFFEKIPIVNCYITTDSGFTEVPAGTQTAMAYYESE